ncbi:MAG: hypothetical protein WCL02_03470 [bacterium]
MTKESKLPITPQANYKKFYINTIYMNTKFAKTKTEHHILPEFHKLLLEIEKQPLISRIIPGRISRQQK